MKTSMKLFVFVVLISSSIVLSSAQNRYRNQRASLNRNRSSNRNRGSNEPVEQGRTLGLLSPLFTLGLSSIARPYIGAAVGYDAPIVAAAPYRPSGSGSSGSTQSDPYYGGYGGYTPNYYAGYNNYFGRFPIYRPIAFSGYPVPIFGGYRPAVYPLNYGYQYNGYVGQRPIYSNPRPNPIAQRPNAIQQPGLSSLTSTSSLPNVATSGTATSQINSAQAAQVANLLGQLLGQQLRPLLNQDAASPAHDVPSIAPENLEYKRYRSRNY